MASKKEKWASLKEYFTLIKEHSAVNPLEDVGDEGQDAEIVQTLKGVYEQLKPATPMPLLPPMKYAEKAELQKPVGQQWDYVMQLQKQKAYTAYPQYQEAMLAQLLQHNPPANGGNTLLTVTIPTEPVDLSTETPKATFHRLLLLGDSGTGKTHFIGTMPKPLVCDFDNGLNTLVGKPVKAKSFGPDDWASFMEELKLWSKEGPQYGCETFAVDSLTMAGDAAMQYVLKKNGRLGQNPQIGDWGEAINQVKQMLGYLSVLKCHVIVSAHNQLVRDEILGDIQWMPLIFGKDLPSRIGIYFDEVYMTTVANTLQNGKPVASYRLQVKPDARAKMLKSRLNQEGKLFEQYEQPDFSALVEKVKNATKTP